WGSASPWGPPAEAGLAVSWPSSSRTCSRTLRPPKEPSNFAYRLVDGRIAERWALRGDLTMLRQLDAPTSDRVGQAGLAQRPSSRWVCGSIYASLPRPAMTSNRTASAREHLWSAA